MCLAVSDTSMTAGNAGAAGAGAGVVRRTPSFPPLRLDFTPPLADAVSLAPGNADDPSAALSGGAADAAAVRFRLFLRFPRRLCFLR